MIRVLLIAPFTDLPGAANEAYAIERSGLDVVRLPPDVRQRDILQVLSTDRFDALWFASHGSANGIQLAGGEMLSIDAMAPLVRSAGATGVVLNTCDSQEIGERIHDVTGVDCICTVAGSGDPIASQTGTLLAVQLADCGDFRLAFERSRPSGVLYRYIPEYRKSLPMPPTNGLTSQFSSEELRKIYEAISDIQQRLTRVEVEVKYMRTDLERAALASLNRDMRTDLTQRNQWIIISAGVALAFVIFWAMIYLNGGAG